MAEGSNEAKAGMVVTEDDVEPLLRASEHLREHNLLNIVWRLDGVRRRMEPHVRTPEPEPTIGNSIVFEGVACDITSQSDRSVKPHGYELMRAGTPELHLSHEHERGWPIALRMTAGTRYQVTMAATSLSSELTRRPKERHPDERTFVFYSPARRCVVPDGSKAACLGVWTDGLMVSARIPSELREGIVYRVTVERLD